MNSTNPLLSSLPGIWDSYDPDHTHNLEICANGDYSYSRVATNIMGIDLNESGTWTVSNNDLILTTSSGTEKKYEIVDLIEGVSAQFYLNGYYSGFDEYLYPGATTYSGSGGGGNTPPSTITDIDGNQYWMGEDLKTTKYQSGENINQGTWNISSSENQDWINSISGFYVNVDGSASATSTPSGGLLYNSAARKDPRKLCPNGFRLPSEADYEILISQFPSAEQAAYALKSTSSWCAISILTSSIICGNGNNSSSFAAKPTGSVGNWDLGYTGSTGVWWTNNQLNHDQALYMYSHAVFSDDLITPAELLPLQNGVAACRCIYE